MIPLRSSFSTQTSIDDPPRAAVERLRPTDLSERIWDLHRTITNPAADREKVKDAKRILLAALITRNELRKIKVPPFAETPVTAQDTPAISRGQTVAARTVVPNEPLTAGRYVS